MAERPLSEQVDLARLAQLGEEPESARRRRLRRLSRGAATVLILAALVAGPWFMFTRSDRDPGAATPTPTPTVEQSPTPSPDPEPTPTPPEEMYRVTGVAECLNVREQPGTQHPIVACLGAGTLVAATGEDPQQAGGFTWIRIHSSDDGVSGWAASRYLTPDDGAGDAAG